MKQIEVIIDRDHVGDAMRLRAFFADELRKKLEDMAHRARVAGDDRADRARARNIERRRKGRA